jgi:hypothetical protein
MKSELVQKALDLFVQTIPMETMSADHPMFWELYEKECQIFPLLERMTDVEKNTYRLSVQTLFASIK